MCFCRAGSQVVGVDRCLSILSPCWSAHGFCISVHLRDVPGVRCVGKGTPRVSIQQRWRPVLRTGPPPKSTPHCIERVHPFAHRLPTLSAPSDGQTPGHVPAKEGPERRHARPLHGCQRAGPRCSAVRRWTSVGELCGLDWRQALSVGSTPTHTRPLLPTIGPARQQPSADRPHHARSSSPGMRDWTGNGAHRHTAARQRARRPFVTSPPAHRPMVLPAAAPAAPATHGAAARAAGRPRAPRRWSAGCPGSCHRR